MPTFSDIGQFMSGQLFQTPALRTVSFAGKTMVITGANSGLGFECAKHLAHLNVFTLILGCRDIFKGEAAKNQILRDVKSSPDIQVWHVDMANYNSVKSFSARVSAELPRLDALLTNAGISTNEYHVAEGLEQTLTVNVVSTLLLSLLCLPKLQETALQTGAPTHLTMTGSVVHCFADGKPLVKAPEGKIFATLSDKAKQI